MIFISLGRLAQSGRALPYKEEVTGSNPVAPTRIFRNLPVEIQNRTKPHIIN